MGGNFLGFNSFVLSVAGVCGDFINLEDLLAQSLGGAYIEVVCTYRGE